MLSGARHALIKDLSAKSDAPDNTIAFPGVLALPEMTPLIYAVGNFENKVVVAAISTGYFQYLQRAIESGGKRGGCHAQWWRADF